MAFLILSALKTVVVGESLPEPMIHCPEGLTSTPWGDLARAMNQAMPSTLVGSRTLVPPMVSALPASTAAWAAL